MPGKGNEPGENHKAGKGQGRAIVPKVRGAFLRAIMQLEEEGYPLSDIIAQQLLEKPLETLAALSRFVPREMMIETPDGTDVVMAFVRVPPKDALPQPEPLQAIEGEFEEIPRLKVKREVQED